MAAPISDRVFDIIADETGASKDEVIEADDFSDLGIDDFLSQSIVSKIKSALQIDLAPSAFKSYSNAAELHSFLQTVSLPKPKPKPSSRSISIPLSLILQGTPGKSKHTLLMFPDGSGAGMAYARFPKLDPDVCVIGFNSPFLRTATKDTAKTKGIEDFAPAWMNEIRERQPHGPYWIGGWSAGGYYCLEVAKLLVEAGEVVEKIIFIDSPCRLKFEALPIEVIHYLSGKGLLGADAGASMAAMPQWFIDHFHFTVTAVAEYMSTPLILKPTHAQKEQPDIFIIWASELVLKTQEQVDQAVVEGNIDRSMRVVRFLLEAKDDFGPNDWDLLFPPTASQGNKKKVFVAKTDGTHFDMVHPPQCIRLTDLIRDVVTRDDHAENPGEWV